MTPWWSSVLPGRPTSSVVSGAVLQSYNHKFVLFKLPMPGTPTWRPHWKVRPESGTAQSSESQSSLAFSMPLSTAAMPASAQKSALFCARLCQIICFYVYQCSPWDQAWVSLVLIQCLQLVHEVFEAKIGRVVQVQTAVAAPCRKNITKYPST